MTGKPVIPVGLRDAWSAALGIRYDLHAKISDELGAINGQITALAQAELSIAFPIGSLQYVMTLFAAHYFLDEKINRLKLIGTFLVVGGIALVIISK